MLNSSNERNVIMTRSQREREIENLSSVNFPSNPVSRIYQVVVTFSCEGIHLYAARCSLKFEVLVSLSTRELQLILFPGLREMVFL